MSCHKGCGHTGEHETLQQWYARQPWWIKLLYWVRK
jgi:hypothetical protein